MKSFFLFFIAVTLAVPTIATAINIDGVRDAEYGSAIVTQQIGTIIPIPGNNTVGNQGIANGSELDAAYGFASNGVLYLVMAGNFNSLPIQSGGSNPNDVLNLFFMTTGSGPAGDHTLGTNYTAASGGRINRMGVGGNTSSGAPGLTFDTGFTPNYWIGANIGPDDADNPPVTMYVDYQVVCSNCPSAFLGAVVATNLPPDNVLLVSGQGLPGLNGMLVSVNNTNLFGVDGTPCHTNAVGAPQSVAAAAVTTGIELAIPLAALGNPTGNVSICSFITSKYYDTIYNQVLGPVWNGAGAYCQGLLGTTAGDPATVNFASYPGQHSFRIPVPPCDVILVNPTSASYTSTGGVGSVTAANAGGCTITVTVDTANSNWLSVTSSTGLGTGNGSFTYKVATNSTIFTRVGQLISTDIGTTLIATSIVTVTQTGLPPPPLGVITVDGTAESTYGCPLTVQQLSTQFGDSINGDLANATVGSELDAAYGIVQNNILFLTFTGNMQGNGNRLDIFLQTGPGGQNTLTNINPNINNLNRMGAGTNNTGLTFHAGFAPNYVIIVNDFAGSLFADYAQLWPGGTNSLGVATNGYYLGSSTPTNGTLQAGGANPFGFQIAINDSNTNGVHGVDTCNTNTYAVGYAPGDVRTGIELAIPLGALGSPTGTIAVCAFINGTGNDFLSNQILPPIGTNVPAVTVCQANLGEPTLVNLSNQVAASFLVGPEPRITSISKSGNNVILKYQTEVDTNMTYQLQRSSSVTNNAVWSNLPGGLQFGGNVVITYTDTNGATNKPARFYRVRQTPLCP